MRISRIAFFSVILLQLPLLCAGQGDTTTAKAGYFNRFTASGLIGNSRLGVSYGLETLHGIRYKQFSFAAGMSYHDYQKFRTVPFMSSITCTAPFKNRKDRAVFISVAGGYSYVRHVDSDFDSFIYREDGGRLWAIEAGYRINAGRWRLYVSSGYSMERIRYARKPRWWSDVDYNNFVTRDMNRIFLGIGFGWN